MRYIERPPAIPECFPLAREAGEGRGEGSEDRFHCHGGTLILAFSRTREKGEQLADSCGSENKRHWPRLVLLCS
jgi:hypothetical protein